jgi:beta-lactamase class D
MLKVCQLPEQLDFFSKLSGNKLPYYQQSIDLVKTIMIIEEKPDYIFRGKTGWTVVDEKNIEWFGFLEKNKTFWPFVLNVESDKKNTGLFQKSREGITMEILKFMKLL